MSFSAQQEADGVLSRLSDEGKPSYGVVAAVNIPSASSYNGKQVALSPNDATYTIDYASTTGTRTLTNRAPSQARWDCWYYPAPVGAIARLYWVAGVAHITLLELPVTSPCGTTPPITPTGIVPTKGGRELVASAVAVLRDL
jgi:hypothetical protein